MERDLLEVEIGEVVKARAKALGITQVDLSKQLGVSIATVKRWYSGKGFTLVAIRLIADSLGLSLTEIFSQVEKGKKKFSYTYKQEVELAKNPELLVFFDYLLKGKSVNQIKFKFNLEDKYVTKILLKLDKFELLELFDNNKVKLLKSGEPVWLQKGPLSKRFKKEITDEFLNQVKDNESLFYLHEYLEEDLPKIQIKLEELKEILAYSNKKAEKREDKKSYGIFFAKSEFNWAMDKFLK
jgi:transcriptional regulator with XRE-family HTH domain